MSDNVVTRSATTNPVALGPNLVGQFYRGGARIAALRRLASTGERQSEDWVASTTSRFGAPGVGMTVLESGELLRDAVVSDPEAYLGPDHLRAFGPSTELLVKLLDAGERLPVHAHPDRGFAGSHLGCRHGKTEAWVIVETERDEADVFLGFRRDVDPEELRHWVDTQDSAAMLATMNRLTVRAGDSVLVPAGAAHAIGAGILLVELQEPTDLSVLLEWDGYAIDGPRDGHLGLGFDVALQCVDRSEFGTDRLTELHLATGGRAGGLLPAEADRFFRADRLIPAPAVTLGPGLAVLVVVDGDGELRDAGGTTLRLHRGMTVLVPWAAGASTLTGSVDVIRCRPPAPAD